MIKLKNNRTYLLGLAIITAGLSACMKEKSFPLEPEIQFISYEAFGSDSAHYVFSFTDGDGDIGLSQNDTAPPYDYNVFMDYYEKQNGEWVKFEFDEIGYTYRIPVLNPGWEPKPLEGQVRITVFPAYNTSSSALSDTFKWSAYMMDRALNQSNTVESNFQVK